MTTKTKKELMEMQVVQAEAIKILIERVEDLKNAGINLENRFEALQNACGDDNIKIQKLEKTQNHLVELRKKATLNKRAFADTAIHTSCDAFFREDFFAYSEGEAGHEYYPKLSCGKKLPKWQELEDFGSTDGIEKIKGTFHFLTDSAADLHLVCSHFADIGEDYYVFFNVSETSGWVIWTPNTEHYNK
jgi:hypothetical protein